MAEGEDADEPLSFDEFMQGIEEARKERRGRVTYAWVETIREAGELYRETSNIDAVAQELNLSEEAAREALTVYRLIFEGASKETTAKAFVPGQTFFSLNQDSIEKLDEDDDEPVEDLLREFVGTVYFEYDVAEEPVGEPPSESVPRMLDPEDLAELTADFDLSSVMLPTAADLIGPSIDLKSALLPSKPLLDPKTLLPPSTFSPEALFSQQEIIRAATTMDGLSEQFSESLRLHQLLMGESISQEIASIFANSEFPESVLADFATVEPTVESMIASALPDVPIPQSVLADLAAIEPTVTSAVGSSADISSPQSPTRTDSRAVTEPNPPKTESKSVRTTEPASPPVPADATVDTALPDRDTFTTELVFEIPALVVKSILSADQARNWFANLPKEHQTTLVTMLLVGVAYYLTNSIALASLASLIAPSIRRAIIED